MNVLATTNAVANGLVTRQARGRLSICNTTTLQFSECVASQALTNEGVDVRIVGMKVARIIRTIQRVIPKEGAGWRQDRDHGAAPGAQSE
jgi:hypothetical protein